MIPRIPYFATNRIPKKKTRTNAMATISIMAELSHLSEIKSIALLKYRPDNFPTDPNNVCFFIA